LSALSVGSNLSDVSFRSHAQFIWNARVRAPIQIKKS
jgi:hypothetical protein